MNGLVHYLRCIPCVEIVDVSYNQFSRGPYCGERSPRTGQEAHARDKKPTHGTRSPHTGQEAHPRDKKPTHGTRSPRTGQEAHTRDKKPTHGTRSPRTGQEAHTRDKKPTHGTRSPISAFEILYFHNLNIIKKKLFRPQRIHFYHYCNLISLQYAFLLSWLDGGG